MAHLGLERRCSRWTACFLDGEGLPQEILVSESYDPAKLVSILPPHNRESVVLSVSHKELWGGDVALSLQQELQRTLGVEAVRLISHPVAVAVCATWSAFEMDATSPPLAQKGQDLLVCDFGEEASTATIVWRGPDELPFVVKEQSTFGLSGQQVDFQLFEALSQPLGWTQNSVSEPTRARALQSVAGMRQTISRSLERAQPGRRVIPAKATWIDDNGSEHNIVLTAELYQETLEPLFASACAELEAFLRVHPQPVSSVMLSGEAARTFGIRHYLLEPALRTMYGDEVTLRLVNAPCFSTPHSQSAGVVGAALVAANNVPYQERLPCDIGARLKVEANGALAHLFQLPPDTQEFWLYPLLSRGDPLPARFDSKDLGLFHLLAPGETLDWDIRWELEGRTFRHCQPSRTPHDKEKLVVIEWHLEADASGQFRTTFGKGATVQEISLFNCTPEAVTTNKDIPSVSLARLQEFLASAGS